MGEQAKQGMDDKGIGEGVLRDGEPPFADRQYAGDQEPDPGVPGHTGTAGGTNVSSQGGGVDSGRQGGNTSKTPDASG